MKTYTFLNNGITQDLVFKIDYIDFDCTYITGYDHLGVLKVELYFDSSGLTHHTSEPAQKMSEYSVNYRHCTYNNEVIVGYMYCINKRLEIWQTHGLFHRIGAPAVKNFSLFSNGTEEIYYENGKIHRIDGPAEYRIDEESGKIKDKKFYVNGKKLSYNKFMQEYHPSDWYDEQINKPIRLLGKKYRISALLGPNIMLEEI